MRWRLVLLSVVLVACGRSSAAMDAKGTDVDTKLHYDEMAIGAAPERSVGEVREIGGANPDQGEFYMVTGATLLPSGEVVVANRGTYELRFYSPRGVLERTAGQRGGGPGEFEVLVGTWLSANGKVLAWDPTQRRMTVFEPDGEMDRVRTVQENFFNPPRVVGLATNGFVLIHEHFESPKEPDQFVDMPADYLYVSFDGRVLDTIATVPWQRLMRPSGMGGGPVLPQIFAASVPGAAGPDGLYFGVASEPEVTAYTLKGQRRWSVSWDAPDRTVDNDAVEQWIQQRAGEGAGPEQRRTFEKWRDEVGVADRFPTFAQLIVARTGDLWVKPYRFPRSSEPLRWLFFESTGALAGTVELPGDMTLLEVGSDYALAMQRDAFESEHVYLMSLTY